MFYLYELTSSVPEDFWVVLTGRIRAERGQKRGETRAETRQKQRMSEAAGAGYEMVERLERGTCINEDVVRRTETWSDAQRRGKTCGDAGLRRQKIMKSNRKK